MLQTALLLMKSLNKTETPIFLSVVCSLFPKAIFLTFILVLGFFVVCSICACLVLSVFSSSWCQGRAAAFRLQPL